MTPVKLLSDLLNVNPAAARLIFTGLGVIAAAAIAATWGNVDTLLPIGTIVLGLGVLLTLIAFIFTQPLMKAFLGWFFIALIVLVTVAGVDAVLGPRGTGIAPPLPCWSTVLRETRTQCEARLRTSQTVVAEAPVSPVARPPVRAPSSISGGSSGLVIPARPRPPGTSTVTSRPTPPAGGIARPLPTPVVEILARDNPIFLHRDPGTDVETAQFIAAGLDTVGWDVQEADVGGRVVKTAPSETQIRFFHADDAQDAVDLATDLSEVLRGESVDVEDLSKLGFAARDGLLEIWLAPGT